MEDYLKLGTRRITYGLHFLEAYALYSCKWELAGDKVEQRYYNHGKLSICSITKIHAHLIEESLS
jgi:hypothetical protein